jgi:ParB/RepB/Spo0J family partition protein
MIQKNLESIVEEFKMPPNEKLEGVPYYSRYVPNFPVSFLINVVDFNNYREHSLGGVDSLSKSIAERGVLEPVALHYDTKGNSWELISGEGRSWGYYLANADVGPVEVYYDLPPEILLRMKIGANSLKTAIDSEDIAKYTQGLYDLIKKYNFEMSGQLAEFVDSGPSVKELAGIMHRSPRTVRNYLIFNNNLHEEIKQYVDNNREKNFYSRSIKIGTTLVNKNHQRMFFSKLLKDESEREKIEASKKKYAEEKGERYSLKTTRLSDYAFKKELKDFAIFVKEPIGELNLKNVTTNQRAGDTLRKHLYNCTSNTKKYIDAFTSIMEQYVEIKEESQDRILGHITCLKANYDQFMNLLPQELSDAIKAYMQKPPEKSLRDKVLEQAELRRKSSELEAKAATTGYGTDIATNTDALSDIKRIRAIGDKIVYISVEDIIIAKSQLRSRYKQESIDALVEEIKIYGQLTPGLVKKIAVEDGSTKYRIVYGHTRFKAVTLAGKKYYKTFVRDDLTDLDVSMLQSIEDLSESDTPVERAKVLNKQYNLMKLIAEKDGTSYDKEDFLHEFRHLGNRKTLKDALEFMELDKHLRNMVATKSLSYDAALRIGKLSDDDRLTVLYNVMTSQLKGNDLDKYIRGVKEKSDPRQPALFGKEEMPKSYTKILEQFEGESMKPFHQMNHYIKCGDKTVLARILVPEVIVQYAHVYKSILRLEHAMLQKNGH